MVGRLGYNPPKTLERVANLRSLESFSIPRSDDDDDEMTLSSFDSFFTILEASSALHDAMETAHIKEHNTGCEIFMVVFLTSSIPKKNL